MIDIVERLREKRAALFYTDSVMRVTKCEQPDSLHIEAAAEIERLRKHVASATRYISELQQRADKFMLEAMAERERRKT